MTGIRDMGRNSITSDHGVRNSGLLERMGSSVHSLAHSFHGSHHPPHEFFVDEKLGSTRILSVHCHCFSIV
jgi:hypothetical protein